MITLEQFQRDLQAALEARGMIYYIEPTVSELGPEGFARYQIENQSYFEAYLAGEPLQRIIQAIMDGYAYEVYVLKLKAPPPPSDD